jgi:mRNA interferase HigB
MHIISLKKLREFWAEHPDSEVPLRTWNQIAKHADWQKSSDVKNTCSNSVDQVGRCTVFNIGSGKYRLVVDINYEFHKVYILHVMTHKEYDRDLWKSSCCT